MPCPVKELGSDWAIRRDVEIQMRPRNICSARRVDGARVLVARSGTACRASTVGNDESEKNDVARCAKQRDRDVLRSCARQTGSRRCMCYERQRQRRQPEASGTNVKGEKRRRDASGTKSYGRGGAGGRLALALTAKWAARSAAAEVLAAHRAAAARRAVLALAAIAALGAALC